VLKTHGMTYTLTCKGDNNWSHNFRTIQGVWAHLYQLYENNYNIKFCELEDCNDKLHGDQFDIEDDMLTLTTPDDEVFECRGWHYNNTNDWYRVIMMPDGKSFYQHMDKLSTI
jgi:hypothetical protein